MMRNLVVLAILAAAMFAPASAWAEKRIALVVGASKYEKVGNLSQAALDADKIHAALKAVGGFSSLPPVLKDPTVADLQSALSRFAAEASTADVAIFYFSGHGMQHDEDNWLIPVGARLDAENDILFQGVRLSDVHKAMKSAKLRIIILDACRNNPFALSWGPTKALGEGLVKITNLPLGSVLAFAAAPGKKTPDNGVYSAALAKYIQLEGLELKDVFERVYEDVRKVTPDAEPNFTPSYQGAFSFKTGYSPPAVVADPETASWLEATTAVDLRAGKLSDSQCKKIRAHKAAFPKGKYSVDFLLAQCESLTDNERATLVRAVEASATQPNSAVSLDPVAMLRGLIFAFQNCGPPQAYLILAPEIYSAVEMQTARTGCYPQIQMVGPVVNMEKVSTLDRTTGPMFRIRVQHVGTIADWIIGLNKTTNQVDVLLPGPAGAPYLQPNGQPFTLPNGQLF